MFLNRIELSKLISILMVHNNETLFLITPYIRKIKARLTATSKIFTRIIKY